jgi:hypothetical protein
MPILGAQSKAEKWAGRETKGLSPWMVAEEEGKVSEEWERRTPERAGM